MYLILLILLMLVKFSKIIEDKTLSTSTLFECIIPYWKNGNLQDRMIGVLQVLIISTISIMSAVHGKSGVEYIILFILTFVTYTWAMRFVVLFILWIQEYINRISLNAYFSVIAPIIILFCIKEIDSKIEINSAFAILLMSLVMVYIELIKIVTGYSSTIEPIKTVAMRKGLKIKSIVTWFMMIIINLYTLLLFVQFYFGPEKHHFIRAESLDFESAVDIFYYLVLTFTTVGFGDIRPSTVLAKLITVIISVSGMLFTGMFIGIILSLDEKE